MVIPKHLQHLFDINYIKRNTPGYNDLKVELRKARNKGTALFARKPIKKGSVIAYYRMEVHDADKYKSPTKNMYTFTVYTKSGNESDKLIADLSPLSWGQPCNGIPFWAYFSNEPSGKQRENAFIDLNIANNYKNRSRVRPGDTITYRLVADRNIKKGEEIVWCYGDAYNRNYEPSCSN